MARINLTWEEWAGRGGSNLSSLATGAVGDASQRGESSGYGKVLSLRKRLLGIGCEGVLGRASTFALTWAVSCPVLGRESLHSNQGDCAWPNNGKLQ